MSCLIFFRAITSNAKPDCTTTRSATLASQASRMSDTQLALGVKNIQDWASKGLESGMFKIDPDTGRLL